LFWKNLFQLKIFLMKIKEEVLKRIEFIFMFIFLILLEKEFEMSLVKWIPNGAVSSCVTCSRSFGIMNRKHHCRLCGAITCNKCSQFLTNTTASRIHFCD
jgi:hypothetical protein